MSLVSQSIANLINGVSQQPNALRLASQCELQENCSSSVVDGLCMRNGTKHSAKITSSPLTNAFTHLINRDTTERYRVVITSGAISVYDLAGNQMTLNSISAEALGYLSSTSPDTDFAALTIADYTFILNKKVTVAADPDTVSAHRPYDAMVWVKTAAPDTTYTIGLDGAVGSVTTGDAAASPETVSTVSIASGLASSLVASLGGSASAYVVSAQGSFVYISRVNGTDFVISATDGYGDQGMNLIKGKTQRFTNLPARAQPGFKVEVQGEGSSFNTSYWVEFISDPSNQFGGVWKETVKPDELTSLGASTMPHVLVREANGTFTFRSLAWSPRKCGDLDSNPMPSFVGRKINDMFFHKNRLGFLSDENMVMSTSSDFADFFRGSAIQVLDTDPIDIAASNTKVSILNHAVPFNDGLLCFSDQSQFLLGKTADVLSPKTAALDLTTEFESSKDVAPIGVGNSVYFAQRRNDFTAIREFKVDAFTQANDAQDTTSHVPKYIPKSAFKLASSTTENIIVCLSREAPSTLFVYQYYLADANKLQSAWHSWTFGPNDTILNADFIESTLHLVISRPDGVYLETMVVSTGVTEPSQQFSVHLDRGVTEGNVSALTYDATANRTSFVLPYTPQPGEDYCLVAWEHNAGFTVGRKVKFTLTGSTVNVTDAGNLQHFLFGKVYKARYVFSTLEVRQQAQGGTGQVAIGEGRVNVRRMTIQHGKSGYFRVEVTPRGRDMYTYVMSGRQIGSSLSLLGSPSLIEGIFHVPVMCRNIDANIEITSDEFLPFSILSADWEAMFVIRSRRM